MPKRPSPPANQAQPPRKSPRAMPSNVVDVVDTQGEDSGETTTNELEHLQSKLAFAIFGHRRQKSELCAIDYLVGLKLRPGRAPATSDYLTHIKGSSKRTSSAAAAKMWNAIKQYFGDDSAKENHAEFDQLVDFDSLAAGFTSVPELTEMEVSAFWSTTGTAAAAPPMPLVQQPSSSRATRISSICSRSTSISHRSSHSSGSNSSSSTLSTRAIMAMTDEFNLNFAAFRGEAWRLPSGVYVDDLLAEHVRTLRKESSLHSFIIDDPASLIALASDPADKAVLSEVLVKRDGERTNLVSEAEQEYLQRFDKEPAKVMKMLAQGWQHVGEADDQPPDEAFREATHASALRKNRDRKAESSAKQAVGRKVDGLIVSIKTRFELCVLEAARKDPGPNGTKALTDIRKLAKVLKDTFDAICAKASGDISSQLIVYGLRIAGPSITFFSMRRRAGRQYQMINDGTVSFPAQWDHTTTITVLTIVASVLALQKRVSEMAKKVAKWTTLSFQLLDTSNQSPMPPTLTTPPGSPRD
ncbi:hypothetical protein DFQ26_001896 [Actinomortierella ambigua]|nr:hypothetical protein DFQ26_001896 [Actinomortierella ambigua]